MPNDQQLPMSGVRVLDFTDMMAGPYCTRILADMGADVVKVEPPAGDHNRTRRPARDGQSRIFGHLNAGKRSIVLDLKSEDGKCTALALAREADIIVENWRPGVADRLGLGYGVVGEINPDIVYCSISGFGQLGPKATRPAYAPIVHAASGFDLAQLQYQDGLADRPANTAIFVADIFGGMSALAAIHAAMFDRQRTGRGHYLDVSLFDGMLNMLVFECQEHQSPSPVRLRSYRPLRAADGFVMVAPTSQRNFERLAQAVGEPEWITDARFSTIRIREENWDALMQLIESWTIERPALECERLLLAEGVPCTRYQNIGQAMQDPQVVMRGTFAEVVDAAGSFMVPNAPFIFRDVPTVVNSHVPGLGEHAGEIRGEIAALAKAS